jgi:hypothetical protein
MTIPAARLAPRSGTSVKPLAHITAGVAKHSPAGSSVKSRDVVYDVVV